MNYYESIISDLMVRLNSTKNQLNDAYAQIKNLTCDLDDARNDC